MREILKVTAINVGIFASYFILMMIYVRFIYTPNPSVHLDGVQHIFMLLYLVLAQLIVNVIGGFICFGIDKPERGKAMLLFGGVMLLIGFSVCGGVLV
jgi:hypothetical protein